MHPPRILPENTAGPCSSSKPRSEWAAGAVPTCAGPKSVRLSYHTSLGVIRRMVPVRISSSKYLRV